MTNLASNRRTAAPARGEKAIGQPATLDRNYFRIRDFEYVQPLYDLAFLLEVDALAKGIDVPKYRTFSLWRAGLRLDGYGTTVDRWLDGTGNDSDLDNIPSSRIRQYLAEVRETGLPSELHSYQSEEFDRCLRLRSVRGLGPSSIALTMSSRSLAEDWTRKAAIDLALGSDRINDLYYGRSSGTWQSAHIVPPLMRFLRALLEFHGQSPLWQVSGISDPFEPVASPIMVSASATWESVLGGIDKALGREVLFRRDPHQNGRGCMRIRHQMGWSFDIVPCCATSTYQSLGDLLNSLDPLATGSDGTLRSDLHLHTAWSDGSCSVETMAQAIIESGLHHFAVTDHSRSSKVQGGLTPPLWLRQANALTLAAPVCPVLHGIEVDILKDGSLDLPGALLDAADIVVASVHSSWTDDITVNTNRLVDAIESGSVDIIAHPTSALVGKPGVPNYVRPAAAVNWDQVFESCARWRVAVELNCFPSRLDLPLDLLRRAIDAGCAISLGSDAHSRSHLLNLRFGQAALRRLEAPVVLNRFSYDDLRGWISASRAIRKTLSRGDRAVVQVELPFREGVPTNHVTFLARIEPPQNVPSGSSVVGIDLTAGEKATGVALLTDSFVETCSLSSDEEILAYVKKQKPKFVSIDSPLGLPGGGDSIDPKAGIMRVAEYDLASIGIPAYPSLIDSMRNLTLRGIRLRRAMEQFLRPPRVIESYPGAAQDILCLPRKQTSLDLLREGLRRLGLTGPGLETKSHDEMDAVTSAIVGRYFEAGLFEPMGVPREAQLIVPKPQPLAFDRNPVICLAGKTGAGKSVVARYLSVFYGFQWIRTRDVIRDLLIADQNALGDQRLLAREIAPDCISEKDLQEFGSIILDQCKQTPLRREVMKQIKKCHNPTVVDAIRDDADVDMNALGRRPVVTWFIECSDSVIQRRLATKMKFATKRPPGDSPVDHTAFRMRRMAGQVITNDDSLEELRWRVDDSLFAVLTLRQ